MGSGDGGAGTIYWVNDDRLVVDNNDLPGKTGLVEGVYQFSTIELQKKGSLEVLGTGSELTLDSDTILGDGTGWLSSRGTVTGPTDLTLDDFSLDVLGDLSGVDNLTIGNGRNLVLHAQTPLHSGKHIFNSVTVNAEGVLTLAPHEDGDEDYTEDLPLELEAENITVETDGMIMADGLGYPEGKGPGSGDSGAGHGGFGGDDRDGDPAGGTPYGDVFAPVTLGSGGGYAGGGGAFVLTANHMFHVDGIISADGGYYGGSGGSVQLHTQILEGSGVIRANGGSDSAREGGAGGRIALDVVTNEFGGAVEAYGGEGNYPSWYEEGQGGPGTIYWVEEDRLVIDNDELAGQPAALVEGMYQFQEVTLENYGHLVVLGQGSTLSLTNDTIIGDGTATLQIDGTLQVPDVYAIDGFDLSVQGAMSGVSDVTLESSSGLTLLANTPLHAGGYTLGNVMVKGGATLILVPYDSGDEDYTNDLPFELTANSLTVASGGVVTSDGLGYAWVGGDGRGLGAGIADLDHGGSGAGHGGKGGDTDYVSGGPTYGSTEEPVTLGSSGGEGTDNHKGGNGGGAIVIDTMELDIDGLLTANGISEYSDGGDGSGGSIWIQAETMRGSGTVQADGGDSNGGGGRIAVYADSYSFTGDIHASGGTTAEDGTVYFDAVDPTISEVQISPATVPTDGTSTATLTVTLLNAAGYTVAGKPVEVALTSGNDIYLDGQLVTVDEYVSLGYSDAVGEVTATISAEEVGQRILTARSDQVVIQEQGSVEFVPGPVDETNSSVESSPDQVLADGLTPVTITITVRDGFGNPIPGVSVTLTATGDAELTQPSEVTDQSGQTTGTVTNTTAEDVTITASADGVEIINQAVVTFGSGFSASVDPASNTLYLGGRVTYTVHIENISQSVETYTLETSGIDPAWVTWSKSHISLPAGGRGEAKLTVEAPSCSTETNIPFEVTITSEAGSGPSETHPVDLVLESSPDIELEAPRDGATSGSRSVVFSWRTDPATAGTLTLYPEGAPGDAQSYTTAEGTQHSVVVENLTRDQTYTWSVQADSTCGTAASPNRSLTIGNGIVFTNHNQSATINRDYDQRFTVGVHNQDSVEHTLTASMINPYEDLILNFVGSGSVDETITLAAGESRQLTLAVHAQDAQRSEYALTAELTADEGTGTPIQDHASIQLTVLSEWDVTVDAGDLDPLTLGREYTITNHGQPITDLAVQAFKPGTREPASMYVTPSVEHARLDTGESLTVTVYPIFTEEDAAQASASSSPHLARETAAPATISYDLEFGRTGGDSSGDHETINDTTSCGADKQLYAVTFGGCESPFPSDDWYCTNRPEITTPFSIPYFFDEGSVTGLKMQLYFDPRSNVRAHSGQYYFNGTQIAEFTSQVPEGSYTFSFSSDLLNTGVAGMVDQQLQLSTQHPNGGHYVSNTGNVLILQVDQATTYACGANQAEAQQAVEAQYPCSARGRVQLGDGCPG